MWVYLYVCVCTLHVCMYCARVHSVYTCMCMSVCVLIETRGIYHAVLPPVVPCWFFSIWLVFFVVLVLI